MPNERPQYCRKAECPNYNVVCYLTNILVRWFPTKAVRDAEVKRLNKTAKTDRIEIIKRCSEDSFRF